MSEQDPIILFWTAPDEALFAPSVIAAVRNVTPALLERERWETRLLNRAPAEATRQHRCTASLTGSPP